MNRLLNHRLSSVEGQQLLGAPLAAERPEARAAPTGENDGIKIGLNPFHLELDPFIILRVVDASRMRSVYEVEGPI